MDDRWELVLVPPKHTDMNTWDAHVRAAKHPDFEEFDAVCACLDPIYDEMRVWCYAVFGTPGCSINGRIDPDSWRWISDRWHFKFRYKRDIAAFKLRWYRDSNDPRERALARL